MFFRTSLAGFQRKAGDGILPIAHRLIRSRSSTDALDAPPSQPCPKGQRQKTPDTRDSAIEKKGRAAVHFNTCRLAESSSFWSDLTEDWNH